MTFNNRTLIHAQKALVGSIDSTKNTPFVVISTEPSSTKNEGSLSGTAIIGIGAASGLLIAGAIVASAVLKRRKNPKDKETVAENPPVVNESPATENTESTKTEEK